MNLWPYSFCLLFNIVIIGASDLFDQPFYTWCQETKETLPQPFDALINLGGECQVAYQMRLHGIRNEALPFDWIITPFSGLKKILEEQFAHFLNPNNLTFVSNEKSTYVFDTYYGIRFLHDFKLIPEFMKDYARILPIYQRRIERFLQLLAESKHALFMRKNINKEQAIELRDLLKKLCPDNDFILLVVDRTPEMKQDWQLESIKNFYLRPPDPDSWKGDPVAWQEIFLSLSLQLKEVEKYPCLIIDDAYEMPI